MRREYNPNVLFHRLAVILPSQVQPIIFQEWDEEPTLKELRIRQTADPAVDPKDVKQKAPTMAEMIQNSRGMATPLYPEMEPFSVPPAGFNCPFVPRG